VVATGVSDKSADAEVHLHAVNALLMNIQWSLPTSNAVTQLRVNSMAD
jgi:hypothetical protein